MSELNLQHQITELQRPIAELQRQITEIQHIAAELLDIVSSHLFEAEAASDGISMGPEPSDRVRYLHVRLTAMMIPDTTEPPESPRHMAATPSDPATAGPPIDMTESGTRWGYSPGTTKY